LLFAVSLIEIPHAAHNKFDRFWSETGSFRHFLIDLRFSNAFINGKAKSFCGSGNGFVLSILFPLSYK